MSKPKAYDRLISGLGLLVFLSGLQNAELVRDDELDDMGNSTMYMPCFPIPTTFDVGGVEVTGSECGDAAVGNQSLWWLAVEPHQQCFGQSMPDKQCSRSTTEQFHCLAGSEWDQMREQHQFPPKQRGRVAKLEMGNWLSHALTATVARIILEEMMNYKVAMVARTGSHGVFERVARHEMYMSLEVWEIAPFKLASDYYVWGEVAPRPFVRNAAGQVAWSANQEAIPTQPSTPKLREQILAIREKPMSRLLQGVSASYGFFVNAPAVERQNEDDTVIVDYWRGHLLQQTASIFSQDGTVKCVDRLQSGTDCMDPEATFYCPNECPSPIWEGNGCCINGKFYPPQCIPEGVTYDDIRADPEWASPNCHEFLNGVVAWSLAWYEAVIVNLKLNYTVVYLGSNQLAGLIHNRTRDGVPTIFSYWKPDPLLTLVNATEVILPVYNQKAAVSFDPLTSQAAFMAPPVFLTKLVQSSVREQEPDYFHFFQNFYWSDQDLDDLMSTHTLAGGDMNVEEAACKWVKANPTKWLRWVSNQETKQERLSWTVVLAVACTAFAVVLGIAAFFFFKYWRSDTVCIPWSDIVVSKPVTVLGTCPMGDILKAKYRSIPVAIKPIKAVVPRSKPQSASFTSSMGSLLGSRHVSLDDFYTVGSDVPTLPSRDQSEDESESDDDQEQGEEQQQEQGQAQGQGNVRVDSLAETEPSEITVRVDPSFLDSKASGEGDVKRKATPAARKRTSHIVTRETLEELRQISGTSAFVDPSNSGSSLFKRTSSDRLTALGARPQLRTMRRSYELPSFNRAPPAYHGRTVDPETRIKYNVTEFMEDSLEELIYNPTVILDQKLILSVVKNVAAGMSFLHSMDPPVLHGMLQVNRVLVDSNLTAKVAEFGVAHKERFRIFSTAPELLLEQVTEATKEQDVYSFGTLMYQVLTRSHPRSIHNPQAWLLDMARGDYKPLELPASEPAVLRALVLRCQHLDPDERPSFEEIDRILQALDDTSISQLMLGLVSKTRLLDDILPPRIGEMLAQGKKVEPEHYKCVTIFFSDIVGFTNISSTQPPQMVMEMLDRLYGKFDEILKKHELFKVETIGDAYMAVGNLSVPQVDHAARVAMFAMDAVKAAKRTLISEANPELGYIQIRCGFHSGPVVASVVGTTNPRYCLFGDTVNVASRMESTSVANCIHLSDAASLAMSAQRKDIPLVYRGYRHIKGKGDMHTFWIQGYHPMQAGSQASAAEGICSAFDVSVQRGRSISAPFIGSSMPYTNTHYHPRQSAATPPAIKSLM